MTECPFQTLPLPWSEELTVAHYERIEAHVRAGGCTACAAEEAQWKEETQGTLKRVGVKSVQEAFWFRRVCRSQAHQGGAYKLSFCVVLGTRARGGEVVRSYHRAVRMVAGRFSA